MFNRLQNYGRQGLRDTRHVFKLGLKALKNDPQIAAYPYMAVIFISLTLPLANGLLFSVWNRFWHASIFSAANAAPHSLRVLLGLGSFTFFYTAFIGAYFTCAASGAVLAKLEGHPTTPLLGMQKMIKRFFRISWFALSSIFFFPLGIIAQRKKLPKGIVWVLTSSFSLHMPQVAPVIMDENKSVMGSLRASVNIFSKATVEGLAIRGLIIVAVPLLGVVAGFAGWAAHHYLAGDTAHLVGWLVAMLVGSVGYVAVKVIGTVFSTAIYWEVKNVQAAQPAPAGAGKPRLQS